MERPAHLLRGHEELGVGDSARLEGLLELREKRRVVRLRPHRRTEDEKSDGQNEDVGFHKVGSSRGSVREGREIARHREDVENAAHVEGDPERHLRAMGDHVVGQAVLLVVTPRAR